ncbi:Putative aliphatic sulfonates-binding protein [Corynebacterium provencense]|uniref:Aliphatic sulfonates-binding protein n=1 Tax=Corynebacterium provencense TaxID=1737425 RepID=A0A2Z3YRE1_9CORY|nr:aliphatic sulfonate ABC transporter substrate-binding protein [Corynebacterium provencense]AWT25084.1 Putative aliphatic sulfonates-binding protein [Corynebacterium provencense]
MTNTTRRPKSRRFRTVRRITATALVAVTAGAALVACSSGTGSGDSSGGGEDSLTMATQPWLGYGPWYIAQDKGYFADQGVNVNITSFDDDSQMTAALGSGDVDIANAATHSALQWLENGQDGYITLVLDTSMKADAILAADGINSVADLKGKKVAFEEGSVSNLLLDHALSENGMSVNDISPVPMAPSDAAVALQAGRVDAAVTYEPYISDTAGKDASVKTLYTADAQPGLISDILFVSKKAMEEKPEAVKKAVAAWGPAIDYYNSDTADAQAIIAKNIGSDAESLKTAFDGVKFYSLEDNRTYLGGEYRDKVLPSVQEAAKNAGIISQDHDPAQIVDTRFVE